MSFEDFAPNLLSASFFNKDFIRSFASGEATTFESSKKS